MVTIVGRRRPGHVWAARPSNGPELLTRLGRGLVAHSVLLAIVLVVTTAAAVATIAALAFAHEVEQAADRRLLDGSTSFQSILDDFREDLAAAGDLLATDPPLTDSIAAGRASDAAERLAVALRLQAVDEAVLADRDGLVIARVRAEGEPTGVSTVTRGPGFLTALRGGTSHGLSLSGGGGSLRYELYVPLRASPAEPPVAVLRLASVFNQQHLDRFRSRTGLDASVFYGDQRVVTTLRQNGSTPLTNLSAPPPILHEVMTTGQEVVSWRDLPGGRVRSRYAPLPGVDGTRVGMFAVSVPVDVLQVELRRALLPIIPVTLAIALLGALLIRRLVRYIRDPVLDLASAAARLRAGDLATPIPPVHEPILVPLAEELEQARSSMQASLEESNRLQQMREQLLHNVAHELRSPLAVLDTTLDVMSSDYAELTPAEFERLSRSAHRTSRLLRALMEDLLSAGSIQQGRFQVLPQPTAVSAIIDAALDAMEYTIHARHQRVDVHEDEHGLLVHADPRYARQVLSNLLSNAAKYSPDGATITIRVARHDAEVRISVEDHGPGIPPAQQAGLFERFYRTRPGHEAPGIGLGLAICKGIVDAHGGRIGLESEVGAGTTVWFTLPVAEAAP